MSIFLSCCTLWSNIFWGKTLPLDVYFKKKSSMVFLFEVPYMPLESYMIEFMLKFDWLHYRRHKGVFLMHGTFIFKCSVYNFLEKKKKWAHSFLRLSISHEKFLRKFQSYVFKENSLVQRDPGSDTWQWREHQLLVFFFTIVVPVFDFLNTSW